MLVTTQLEGGIATVCLNRPEKKNAMSLDLLDELLAAALALRDTPGLRAVILTGAGNVFSAGIDVSMMMTMAGRLDELKAKLSHADASGANAFQSPVTSWAALPVPVIAAVEGLCFGAGMQLALGADFRIVAPDTRMSIMEAKWGLIPDMGITQSLPKLMRADQAKMLMMTGTEVTGAEAVGMGLATEISDTPLNRARDLAAAFSTKSPEALAGSKRLVEEAWGGGEEALRLEAILQAALMGSSNQMEAVMANMQKRPPKFG
ncbi:MAG: crotonase/enoyl-CoA hydratase family protein [Pseudomonadota bacterium]